VSLRLEMLQVARLAPRLLGGAVPQLVAFLQDEWHEDGGARKRDGKVDLYYTPFLLETLFALEAEPPRERVRGYLEGFGVGTELDLVHQACLVRAWAALERTVPADVADAVSASFEAHRARDGGYGFSPGAEEGALYNAFLALGVSQDARRDLPDPDRLAASLERLRCEDGGYANDFALRMGTTPTTAAAVTLLRHLGAALDPRAAEWLLARCHPRGGFLAMPEAPMPDLLSTATALHALAGLGVPFDAVRERCLDFVDTLWTGRGFVGTWDDDQPDCEYTFYALLALGHLAV
jgi:hypothetical protein